jgi:cytochrome c-type biogenesis protein CcmF
LHSFTQSPIGPVFLVFLGLVLILSLGLMAGRAHLLTDEGRIESPVSREAAFLLNNLVFVVFTFTVLLGTIFPLLAEAVRGAKVSVGEPYFDRMAVPLGLVLVFLMGFGPALPWGRARLNALGRGLLIPVSVGAVSVIVAAVLGVHAGLVLTTLGLAMFALVVTLRELFVPIWQRIRERGESFSTAWSRTLARQRRRFGGYVVHLAVLIVVVSIAFSQSYKKTAEGSLTPGQSLSVGDFRLTFVRAEGKDEPHRFSVAAVINAEKNGQSLGVLDPRLNFYANQREPVGSPVVRTVGFEDLYLSLMAFEPDGSRVSLKIFVVPLVSWIWWSIPLLVLGTIISLWPRRQTVAAPVVERQEVQT